MQYVTLETLVRRSLLIKAFYLAFRKFTATNIDFPLAESACSEMIEMVSLIKT